MANKKLIDPGKVVATLSDCTCGKYDVCFRLSVAGECPKARVKMSSMEAFKVWLTEPRFSVAFLMGFCIGSAIVRAVI